jgi:hypothetical protein
MIKLSEWRFSLEVAWDDLWFRVQTMITAFAFFVGLFFWLRRMIPIGIRSSLLVFHYNPYLGIDEVQPWSMMFLYLFVFLSVLIINFILSFQLFRHDRIASRVLLLSSTLFTAFILIDSYFISSVNN